MQQLTAQNDDLSATVETLKKELIASHQDAERASAELDAMRARAYQENAQESMRRERELRETQSELERLRLERDEWERMALQERVLADETKVAAETYKRELELEREARARDQAELDLEIEKSTNLQSVLEDFQAGKSLHVAFGEGITYPGMGCSEGARTTTSCGGLSVTAHTDDPIVSRVQASCSNRRGDDQNSSTGDDGSRSCCSSNSKSHRQTPHEYRTSRRK